MTKQDKCLKCGQVLSPAAERRLQREYHNRMMNVYFTPEFHAEMYAEREIRAEKRRKARAAAKKALVTK